MRGIRWCVSLVCVCCGALAQPYINGHSVRNGASYSPPSLTSGAIAQGSIFALFGTGLGPAAGAQVSAFPLQTTFSGVSVSVFQGQTSVAALPIYVSATQLDVIMPSNAPLGRVSVEVTYNSQTSNPSPLTVVPSNFGIFAVNSAGVGPGVVTDFVSASSEPVNSLTAGAAPGQTVIIWGTGLGAAPADNVAPTAGNLPVQTEVFVGGVSAPVTYHGRSPCCSGLDQIAVTLPANSPTGCYVPVVVRTGGTNVSNAVTMAISAQSGTACSDSFNAVEPPLITGQSIGIVTLQRVNQTVNVIVPTPANLQSDWIAAGMFQTKANPFFFQPMFALPPQGTCTTYTGDSNVLSTLNFPAEFAGSTLAGAQLLDAGASISVSNGASQSIPAVTVPVEDYVQLLGGSVSPNSSTPLFFNPPSAVAVSAPGGANVGAFSVSIPTSGSLQWTNQNFLNTVSRSAALTVNWTASASSGATVLIAGGNFDTPNSASAIFMCTAPASAGTFTVPTWALANIPPTPKNASLANAQVLLALAPLSAPTSFSASGLNSGFGLFINWLSQSVIWQ